jgi:WD40 repeat protein
MGNLTLLSKYELLEDNPVPDVYLHELAAYQGWFVSSIFCYRLIKVWDLRKNYSAYKREPLPCHTLPYPGRTSQNGFTNLVLDPGKLKLYASCMDNVIYCYNVATYETTPSELYNRSYYTWALGILPLFWRNVLVPPTVYICLL